MEEDKLNPLDFWDKYELLLTTDSFTPLSPDKKICRFCQKREPDTSFKNVPHAIPELLGENSFTTFDECDKCNIHFSKYESHLSKFFLPYLAMVGVKGKKKMPEFNSRTDNQNEETRTIVKSQDDKTRQVILNSSSISDYKIDEEKKTLSLRFRYPPHKPFWVYKSLVKIALSLLPEDHIERYRSAFEWLLEKQAETNCFTIVFLKTLPVNKFARPYAELYKAKEISVGKNFIPELTLVLGFANQVIQVFLPLPDDFDYEHLHEKEPALNVYPSVRFDRQPDKDKYIINTLDLYFPESITYDETIHFKFDSADLNIHNFIQGLPPKEP